MKEQVYLRIIGGVFVLPARVEGGSTPPQEDTAAPKATTGYKAVDMMHEWFDEHNPPSGR